MNVCKTGRKVTLFFFKVSCEYKEPFLFYRTNKLCYLIQKHGSADLAGLTPLKDINLGKQHEPSQHVDVSARLLPWWWEFLYFRIGTVNWTRPSGNQEHLHKRLYLSIRKMQNYSITTKEAGEWTVMFSWMIVCDTKLFCVSLSGVLNPTMPAICLILQEAQIIFTLI